MPATKSLSRGTCASTLLPTIRSAPPALARPACAAERLAEELDQRRHADASRPRAPPYPKDRCRAPGCPLSTKVLQQVAVVARELDHETVRAEPEPPARHVGVAPRRAPASRPSTTRNRRSCRTAPPAPRRNRPAPACTPRTPWRAADSASRRRASASDARNAFDGGCRPRSAMVTDKPAAACAAARLPDRLIASCSALPKLPRRGARVPQGVQVLLVAQGVHRLPEAPMHPGGELAVGRQDSPSAPSPKRCRAPSISSSTLGSSTKKPPLIRPPSACGFSSKDIACAPSITTRPKRAGGRTQATVALQAALLVKGDLRGDIDVRQAVAVGHAERLAGIRDICRPAAAGRRSCVSSPVSTSVTFHGSLRQSWYSTRLPAMSKVTSA